MGEPVDGKGPLPLGPSLYSYSNRPPPTHGRRRIGPPLNLGGRAFNPILTCCSGQRMGFFELPHLLERASPSAGPQAGAIIGIFTLLADGKGHNEPVAYPAFEAFLAQARTGRRCWPRVAGSSRQF
jgi:flagellar biosynthesis/type III secretory pathway ATPase